MLPLLVRLPTIRLSSAASFRLLKRAESISLNQPFTNQHRQIFRRTRISIVIIGATGILLHTIMNHPTVVSRNNLNGSEQYSSYKPQPYKRPLSTKVKKHLRSTYAHFASGLILSCGISYALHRTGWPAHVMKTNKLFYLGMSLIGTICTFTAARLISSREHLLPKYVAWNLFNSTFGFLLAPIWCTPSVLLARSAFIATGIIGSFSFVGLTARSEQYLWLGTALMSGVVAACFAWIGSAVIPARGIHTLSKTRKFLSASGLFAFAVLAILNNIIIAVNATDAKDVRLLSPIDEALDYYLSFLSFLISGGFNDD